MRVVRIVLNEKLTPYVEFISGHKNKYKKGIEQKGYPLDQKAYISEPKPLNNTFLNSYNGIIIPNPLFKSYVKSLELFAELLPIYVENIGDCTIINITKNGNNFLNYDESYFRHYHENIDKPGKLIENQYLIKSDLRPSNIIFLKEKIEASAFGITHNNSYFGPFYTIGFFPEEEEFASLIIKNNIKGIEFYDYQII
jgi:hypothetical protein